MANSSSDLRGSRSDTSTRKDAFKGMLSPDGRGMTKPSAGSFTHKATLLHHRPLAGVAGGRPHGVAAHFRVCGMFAGNAAHEIAPTNAVLNHVTVSPGVNHALLLGSPPAATFPSMERQMSDLLSPPPALVHKESHSRLIGSPDAGMNPLQPGGHHNRLPRTTAAHFFGDPSRRRGGSGTQRPTDTQQPLQLDDSTPFTPDVEYEAFAGGNTNGASSEPNNPSGHEPSAPEASGAPCRSFSIHVPPSLQHATAEATETSFGPDGQLTTSVTRRASLRRSSFSAGERNLQMRRNRSFGGIEDVNLDPKDSEGTGAGLRRERSLSGAETRRGSPSTDELSFTPSARRLSKQVPAPQVAPQPLPQMRSFRRMSYASPEAQHGNPEATPSRRLTSSDMATPHRRSSVKQTELTPFEEFSRALQTAVSHPAAEAVTSSAKRRQSVALDPRPDPFLFPESAITPRPTYLAVGNNHSSTTGAATPRDGAMIPILFAQRSSNSNIEMDDTTEELSGAIFEKRGTVRRRSGQFRSLLISSEEKVVDTTSHYSGSEAGDLAHEGNASGSRTSAAKAHSSRREGHGSATPKDAPATTASSNNSFRANGVDEASQKRSEVEAHLYRASLAPIPLHFVVNEVHERIHRDRMLLDLIYFIPFIVIFSLYFVSRDITTNFYAVAALSNRNTNVDPSPHQVDVVNEFFRIDTQINDGNQALYMRDDGTDYTNAVYGPQIYRVIREMWIPPIESILNVRSKTLAHRWLLHVLLPNLWDCSNPDVRKEDKTVVSGNVVLLGAARLRSLRVKEGCSINEMIWQPGSRVSGNSSFDMTCYDAFTVEQLDTEAFCNMTNPATPLQSDTSRLGQVTPVRIDAATEAALLDASTTASESTTSSSFDVLSSGSSSSSTTLVSDFTETLFEYFECPYTSTTGASEMSQVSLRHPCSGHVMTLPFQASCNQVKAAVEVFQPLNATPSVSVTGGAADSILHSLLESLSTRMPSNSCSAFLFHPSVRVFVAEYFSYAVDSDSFFRSRMILEITESGAVVPTHSVRMFRVWTTNSIYQLSLQGLVLLFLVRFVLRTLSEWKTSKNISGSYLTFLKDPWNIMDVANNVTLLASAILTALWWSASTGIQINFNRDPRYPQRLERVEELFSMQVYCNAVNIVLIYLKVLKFLRINDRLSVMTKTLGECQQDIIALMVLFLFLHTGFAISATAIYGTSMMVFRSVDTAFVNLLFALILGIDYDAMRRVEPTFTAAFFWTFIVTELFLLLNFFIAILGEGFAQVNQSMHLPALDLALLRVVDEIRMVLRWQYIREFFFSSNGGASKRRVQHAGALRLTSDDALDHIQSLVLMHACLKEHLRLSLQAVEDIRVATVREHVPMYFRDMAWWLPKDVYASLGGQYLLVLWEEMVYSYNIKEKLNARSGDRSEFCHAVEEGIKRVLTTFPDVLSLEVQAEVVLDKLDKLPLKIANWSVAQENIRKAALLSSQGSSKEKDGNGGGSGLRRTSSARGTGLERRRSSAAANKPQKKRNPEDALLAQLSSPMF